jgi:hypothetical protein
VAGTTGLAIGTAVSLPAEHDAIALAKAIATLDRLSGGRFTLRIGCCWASPGSRRTSSASPPGPTFPSASPSLDEGFPRQLAQAREVWVQADRDPAKFDLTVIQLPAPMDQWSRALDRARQVGMRRVLFMVADGRDGTLRQLDKLAALLDG